MRVLSRCLVAACALAAGVAVAASAAPGGAAVSSHGVVISARTPVGGQFRTVAASPTLRIGLEFFLPSRDANALRAFVAGVSAPGSATFHHYLARGQFARRFGASSATIATVRTYLSRHGMTGISTSADRLFVRATGTARVVQRLLHTTISQYLYKGRRVYSNTTRAVVPAAIARSVRTIVGLSDVPTWHPHLAAAPRARRPATTTCSQMSTGTNATTGPFTIPQVGGAYHYDAFGPTACTDRARPWRSSS